MTAAALGDRLHGLRLARQYGAARELIRSQPQYGASAALQALLHEHDDFWWRPIVGRRARLKRRDADDAVFVRSCWADAGFMRRFNRGARPLPPTDPALRQLLDRECALLPSEAHALHWTVCTADGPVGFVSATEIAGTHRRCEFLIGFPQRPPGAAAFEAAQLAIGFLCQRLQIERLTAHFYPDNGHAMRVARKFGFREEGVLKGFLRDADGSRSDLVVAGLLLAAEHHGREMWRVRQRDAKVV